MVRSLFALLLGASLGLELVVSPLLPPPFNFICFAVGVFFVLVVVREWYMHDGERYLALALKETGLCARERLLDKAADAATRKSQQSTGARRAWHLLTLAKVRREQGWRREGLDAAEHGLLAISKISGELEVRMALMYMTALLSYDSDYHGLAMTELERIVAVPLHDLTDHARQTQLQACKLLIELLLKAGNESRLKAIYRRAYVLGD